MILNVKPMYTRKSNNQKIFRRVFLSYPISYTEKTVIWSFSRSKTQNGQIMRRNLFSKYVLFHLAFHRSQLPDYITDDQKLKCVT